MLWRLHSQQRGNSSKEEKVPCQQAAFTVRCEAGKASRGKVPLPARISPRSLHLTACLLLAAAELHGRGDIDQFPKGGNTACAALEYIWYSVVCGMVQDARTLLFWQHYEILSCKSQSWKHKVTATWKEGFSSQVMEPFGFTNPGLLHSTREGWLLSVDVWGRCGVFL